MNLLANDKNNVIKPSDTRGKIVVMDTDDYEKARLDILTNRVTLALPFHHKFTGTKQVLQISYNKMITYNPDLKQIFQDPPMTSFSRAPNIRD